MLLTFVSEIVFPGKHNILNITQVFSRERCQILSNLEFVHTFNFQTSVTSEKMFKMNTTVESAVAKLSNQLRLLGLGDS